MRIAESTLAVISKGAAFFNRQPRDWKITVARSNANFFIMRMLQPYLSVYTRALGATGTQLGIISSVGMGVSGLTAPFLGWLTDRIGVKGIYLTGIALLALAYLVYSLAQNWTVIIIAMMAYALGMGIAAQSCAVICANSLASKERATGMAICETAGMGLLGITAPMVGASLVTSFGGISVSGIRPLFFISLAGVIGTFLLILTQLSNRRWGNLAETSASFFKGFSQMFKQGHNLKRWLIISSVGSVPMGMVMPFVQPYAHEFKGADQYVLGAMVTASALAPLALGIPVGRLADKIGRKKVIYMTMPFMWAAMLMLILAPSPGFLVVSGALQGFFMTGMVVGGAMTFELVHPEEMGRWMGITRFFGAVLGAGAVYLAGLIWDSIGPQYLFLSIIGVDIFIRIPLLIGMPETLGLRAGTEQTG